MVLLNIESCLITSPNLVKKVTSKHEKGCYVREKRIRSFACTLLLDFGYLFLPNGMMYCTVVFLFLFTWFVWRYQRVLNVELLIYWFLGGYCTSRFHFSNDKDVQTFIPL